MYVPLEFANFRCLEILSQFFKGLSNVVSYRDLLRAAGFGSAVVNSQKIASYIRWDLSKHFTSHIFPAVAVVIHQ